MCPPCHVPGPYDCRVSRPDFDVNVPHPARVWDYWLGGKDNFAVDREVASDILRVMPVMAEIARGCRLFLAAAVHYLAAEAGIRQFLDIGTGLPTAANTHELAQRVAPDARIVYVDNDPIVVAHAEALLRSGPHGMCAYVDADARDTRTVLAGAAKILDFSQPVAVIMLGILHYIPDDDDPYAVVRSYLDAVCPGSYLVASHASSDIEIPGQLEATDRYNSQASTQLTLRSQEQFAGFLRDLDLIPPGITPLGQWSPGASATGPATLPTYTAVARKP
jgi:SAM-dependent methyltransferase